MENVLGLSSMYSNSIQNGSNPNPFQLVKKMRVLNFVPLAFSCKDVII